MLVIVDDGQVDEEAEHPRPQEVPETHRDEEHDGPVMGEEPIVFLRPGFSPSKLGEIVGFQGKEQEGNHFHGREEGTQGQVDGGLGGPVIMVARSDHARSQVKDDVQVNHPDGGLGGHQPQHHEEVGHHDGGEKLEETLDPQMHHPPAPKIRNREIGMGGVNHAR